MPISLILFGILNSMTSEIGKTSTLLWLVIRMI